MLINDVDLPLRKNESPTVPTFNSGTKCVGSPGIMNDRMPDCYPAALAWIYE